MKSEEKVLGMNTEQQQIKESLDGLLEKQDKNESSSNELIERIDIETTPFQAVRKEKDWYVMIGNYVLTPKLHSKDEAIEEAMTITWNKIVNILAIMVEELKYEKPV